ncbi:MAG TPA: malonyl-CoA decarboxylase family protein [Gammaproteobacteria bacterium]
MRAGWLEKLWDSVADRGRDLLHLPTAGDAQERLRALCTQLLHGSGEASGTALAREVVQLIEGLDDAGRLDFLEMLANDFGPDRDAILAAADAYRAAPDDLDAYLALQDTVEPPRQELLRRINRAARATTLLVQLRAGLLRHLRQRPQLRAIDADFRHLFHSWFNRGFLELRRIDWESSAAVLERLIHYEAVHLIQGWGDLRRRLADDRRCFAFFHPALPDDPLIFVEVALVKGLPAGAAPLLDLDTPLLDPASADSAIFYSINNCQDGLRGVSFGNFLIKQVMAELVAEFPQIERYATLSPIPRFAEVVRGLGDAGNPIGPLRAAALLAEDADALCSAAEVGDPVQALLQLLDGDLAAQRELLAAPLARLALAYVARARGSRSVFDPVAQFHLANGARLERVNPYADLSSERLRGSFGVMVNYLYDPDSVERNHERFVNEGVVAVSKPLQKELRRIDAAWNAA